MGSNQPARTIFSPFPFIIRVRKDCLAENMPAQELLVVNFISRNHQNKDSLKKKKGKENLQRHPSGSPSFDSSADLQKLFTKAESLLYTVAGAAVAVVLKDGLSALDVSYANVFPVKLLTVIVKIAIFALTKPKRKHLEFNFGLDFFYSVVNYYLTMVFTCLGVESILAMQNLQPKIDAIKKRYAGNHRCKQARINSQAGCFPPLASIPVWICLFQALSNVANEGQCTEGSFWIPSLGGPTTVAARQCGSVISWLIPFVFSFFVFVDHNILEWSSTIGWHTFSYLVLPVLPVVFRFVSMELMKPPSFHQVDEALDEAYASSASNRFLIFLAKMKQEI
ncbi:hypothetical protein V6Z11_D05G100000 [Gossypium hirsutum]